MNKLPARPLLMGSPYREGSTPALCVILSKTEFGKIEAGDVLVCPTTSPVWSVLFGSVGALVTDKGDLLSHPAIIAWEYHIPAVVATGNATKLLRDGQVVTVDGTSGHVEILPDEQANGATEESEHRVA